MNLSNILFIDIETVPLESSYEDLDEEYKRLWDKKSKYWIRVSDDDAIDTAQLFHDKAGIYSEFAKVVCISVGYINTKNDAKEIRLNSYYGHDEKQILNDFSELLTKHFNDPNKFNLCGHNIKEFDIPFLARRMVINAIRPPKMLDIAGKKPWEIKHLFDTLEMWKYGDYKNYTSLALLAKVLGIKSPKDDIDGSMVGKVYWEDNDLERIKKYCEKDVITVANIFLKLNFLPLIE